jgi:hypothetical protein
MEKPSRSTCPYTGQRRLTSRGQRKDGTPVRTGANAHEGVMRSKSIIGRIADRSRSCPWQVLPLAQACRSGMPVPNSVCSICWVTAAAVDKAVCSRARERPLLRNGAACPNGVDGREAAGDGSGDLCLLSIHWDNGNQMISVRPAAPAPSGRFTPKKYTANGVGLGHCAETRRERFSVHAGRLHARLQQRRPPGFWTCSVTRYWPPGLMRVTYLWIT